MPGAGGAARTGRRIRQNRLETKPVMPREPYSARRLPAFVLPATASIRPALAAPALLRAGAAVDHHQMPFPAPHFAM